MTDADLISAARALAGRRVLSDTVEVASVGAALVTSGDVLHRGVSIDVACGIGFCAEHAAIAAMITAGESRIRSIVAVDDTGAVLPPCGRCRELIAQVDPGNGNTRVLLPGGAVARLDGLLPHSWLAVRT